MSKRLIVVLSIGFIFVVVLTSFILVKFIPKNPDIPYFDPGEKYLGDLGWKVSQFEVYA